jgi:hypothetical protein
MSRIDTVGDHQSLIIYRDKGTSRDDASKGPLDRF